MPRGAIPVHEGSLFVKAGSQPTAIDVFHTQLEVLSRASSSHLWCWDYTRLQGSNYSFVDFFPVRTCVHLLHSILIIHLFETWHFIPDAGGPDIESAEMDALMDDILQPSSRSSGATSSRGGSANPRPEDSSDGIRGDTDSTVASSTSNRQRSSSGHNKSRRRSSPGLGPAAAVHHRQHSVAKDLHTEEIDGAVVVGSGGGRKRRRRSSSLEVGGSNDRSQTPESGWRRPSSDNNTSSSSRKNSKGVLERINDGVSSIGPAVRRSSANILKQVGSNGVARASFVKTDYLNPDAGNSGGTSGKGAIESAAEAGNANSNSNVNPIGKVGKRASLLKVAMRSRAAAAAVDGHNYEAEADAEADESKREGAMSVWNLEFHDPILEKVYIRYAYIPLARNRDPGPT